MTGDLRDRLGVADDGDVPYAPPTLRGRHVYLRAVTQRDYPYLRCGASSGSWRSEPGPT